MPLSGKDILKGFQFRKKKPCEKPDEMRTATTNEVANAVDDFRPALEKMVRTCNNNSVVPPLAIDTCNLLLQPVRDLPGKLAKETSFGKSMINSVDCGAIVTGLQVCKEKTEVFARGIEMKDETVMLVSLNEMVKCVRLFVKHTSLGYDKDLINRLDTKAQALQQAIEKCAEKSNATFHNHSTGPLNACTGVGDQMLNFGAGNFFKGDFTPQGPVSFGGAATQTPVTAEQPAPRV
ncbi:hypothetical protein B0T09DRAFT_390131 [Sordaria sp. MPI-SDFR-AT-0083]|nr:hypothetical protein B0T09DRAFT_390131 [Sordaria sp. MPI-SDFR-AT-0083]